MAFSIKLYLFYKFIYMNLVIKRLKIKYNKYYLKLIVMKFEFIKEFKFTAKYTDCHDLKRFCV